MASAHACPAPAGELNSTLGAPNLSALIEVIGCDKFGDTLIELLENFLGIDHCAIYQQKKYEFKEVLSHTNNRAELYCEADFGSYQVRREFCHFDSSDARVQILPVSHAENHSAATLAKPQSILVVGRSMDTLFALKLMRYSVPGAKSDAALMQIRSIANVLISLVARHYSLLNSRIGGFEALASLDAIEERIHSMNRLSRREAEVCARILFGLSSCEIATDLGIGKESVMTYRKRAYQHLDIGSQRELMLWYFDEAPRAVAA